MTIPSYAGLNTALSGLEAAQAAIDTTGQNIANANTPGYSRQQVVQTDRVPLTIPSLSSITGQGSQVGLGVDITTISRVRDQFLDSQYRNQNSQENGDSTTSGLLGQVQAALNEPSGTGLSTALNGFWTAWNGLQNDPTDQGAMSAVIGAGQTVAENLNTMSDGLTTLEGQVTEQYTTLTDATSGPVASDANQIAALNTQISQAQASGLDANHAARSARQPDRRPLAVLQRVRHPAIQRHGRRELRQRRQGRRQRHGGPHAAGQRVLGRPDRQPDRQQPERVERHARLAPRAV